jgi:tetratricopeptide (TPR) repeat protein
MRHLRWLFVLPVWFGLIILPLNAWAKPEDSVQFYLDNYGRADSKDKLVRRVHQVFEKMKLVADKRYHRLPQLAIVKGFDSPEDCLIIALPDGYLVLSKQALDMIYKNVPLAQGDTRAAFVLGHELAHLANDDHWHRAFLSVVRKTPSFRELVKNYRSSQGINAEIEADDHGFIYAAMAGYPVDKLLADDSRQQNFFVYWEQQTFRRVNNTHPDPEVRANLLRARLQALLDSLPYFHFGVRLSHFERCDDGIYFLREFVKKFPGREVYNNLGVCELQKAQKVLGKEAYLYWLPSVLDITTRVENLSYAHRGERSTLADEFLSNAEEYFKSALDMEPSYLQANVNLAITAFYLGEIYQARAAIEKARQLAPDDLDIQGLRAVILYEEGSLSPYVDMWPYIIQQLDQLAQQPNAPLSVLYNMARFLELRKRTGADKIWQRLARQVADLPTPIRRIVCEKTACPRPPCKKVPKASWDLPVKLGTNTSHNKTLRQWQKSEMKLYDLYEQIYQHPNGKVDVLALRELVEMVVLKKRDQFTRDDLPDYCGQPLRQRRVVNGTLWSCDHWTALVVDEKVKEVWVVSTTD